MSRLSLAILISGRGSNMDRLLQATTAPDYPAMPQLVLSNRPAAEGLERDLGQSIAWTSMGMLTS